MCIKHGKALINAGHHDDDDDDANVDSPDKQRARGAGGRWVGT